MNVTKYGSRTIQLLILIE